MGSRRAARHLIVCAALAALPLGAAKAACSAGAVDVRGPSGSARFNVEVSDSAEERARGLMFREKLPRSAGMLFVYPAPQRASFWMRNTLIPLDMIFADEAGRVKRVHAMAKPGDTTRIDGGEGIALVLEINGGLAGRLGIAEGSELRSPLIDQATAAWPCGE